jgi:AraC family transcriptional regulator
LAASRRSQAEYNRRMNAVIDHIDRHLDQKLDLAALADIASFSPFHFHRLFRALLGEALGDYVRRRRLEIAGVRLLSQPRVSVLNIALGVGFGSAEAFTRAFRAKFACSPTEWRDSKRGQMAGKRGQAARPAGRKNGVTSSREPAMKVTIIDRPPVHVAYLRHTGAYGPSIGKFWMETVAPWMSTNNLMGRERFGLALDDPTVTAPAKCRYDACVQSPEKEMLSGDPGRKVIPGGKIRRAGVRRDRRRNWCCLGRVAARLACRRADCSSTLVRSSSTTRWMDATTRRVGASPATSACPYLPWPRKSRIA